MTDRMKDKVVFITGAARGQGRAHAVKLASEGADIIAVDVCAAPAAMDYNAATPEDLQETVAAVEALGRRVVHRVVDVRDLAGLESVVSEGVEKLGGIDAVVANAGFVTWGRFWEIDPQTWDDVVAVNLTGVFKTMRAAVPAMIEGGRGGSIIITSSVAGLKSLPAQAPYSAAKSGVVGLAKTAAIELAEYNIRVNTIHPWGVTTEMGVIGPDGQAVFGAHPDYGPLMQQILKEPRQSSPEDIANLVVFLASDESRTITAAQIPIDHGATKV
ncbi:SDR family mycofactocin-dependent oxidoreductase [Rhodococcus sp. 06-221-2]|uniref:mycofactocin-coupled SDR family oxidoreductase n=1 Tax=Rhodococcus sp. 06-221-2 TaxID=2022514 RepID=UPI000B9ADA7F|nr:mycofactocin-coupled SDR family oxidoreductase [Rhodococcus sp. 06-221-2]OZD00403.1 SDR family mycofactocin-dependent oxidoreductase [Rhodococcus sp. 06-221-2]